MQSQIVNKKILFLFFALFFATGVYAQQPAQVKIIEVVHADIMDVKRKMPDLTRLLGDVRLRHEDMTMTCDSAYFFKKENRLDAFSRVHITNDGGSVTIDGNFAKYDGNTKLAEIWGNVVLVDSNAVMKTQHLYYNRITNIAYYLVGAEIINKENNMVSKYGHYHRNTNMFYAKKDVVLVTKDYNIVGDTLNYNVKTKVADFVGPTYIQNEKDTIYCERGWYDTNDTIAFFRQNAWIKSGSTTVNADTLFYESKTGNGRGFSNIVIVDTTNNVILKGHKGWFNNTTENAWLTRKALLIMASKQDSLFLHADTLRSIADTAGFKIMKAYNRVRFFSRDMQGKCDSLVLSLKDTVIHMFRLPVLWAQDNQMTAEHIEIETENQKPRRINMINKGFIVQEDLAGFNQIKSKKIIGLFRDNELYRVEGYNDSETVYYLYDGTDLTGVNKMKSANLVILIENKQAQEIKYYNGIDGGLIPINEFDQDELTLLGFKWHIELKPVDKDDIYEWKEEAASSAKADAPVASDAPGKTGNTKTSPASTKAKEKPANTRNTPATNDTRERPAITRERPANSPTGIRPSRN